jgi:hypothetical protein
LPGLVEGGEDRIQPAIERAAQLQDRDVAPGVQWVVVDQFQQHIIHLCTKPGHLRGGQNPLRFRRDQRDDQQAEARESRNMTQAMAVARRAV